MYAIIIMHFEEIFIYVFKKFSYCLKKNTVQTCMCSMRASHPYKDTHAHPIPISSYEILNRYILKLTRSSLVSCYPYD